jgi:hypothetical protein
MDTPNNNSELVKPDSAAGTALSDAAGTALSDADFKARLEALALEIEYLKCTTIFKVSLRVAEAHKLFLYRRDEGGFQGWVEDRLGFSRAHAYRLLDVAQLAKVSQAWDTFAALPATAIYRIASPSTPEPAREEILRRLRVGERLSGVAITKIIDAAKPNKTKTGTTENNVVISGNEHLGSIEDVDHGADAARHDQLHADGHDRPDNRLKVEPASLGTTTDASSTQSSTVDSIVLEGIGVFFSQASGAEIVDRIPTDKRTEVLAAFPLDEVIKVFGEQLRAALPANPILKLRAMDDDLAALTLADAFGPRLDAITQKAQDLRAPQGRRAGKQSNKAPKHKVTLPQAGVDPHGNHHFAPQRGTRSQPH